MINSQSSLSLIIPALNEEKVVQQVITDIYAVVSAHFMNYEVILVDDGSKDATGGIMDAFAKVHPNVSVVHNKRNISLGGSFQKALPMARCDHVMLLCGDGGLPASSLPLIFENIGKADIVIPYINNLKRIKSPGRYLLSRTYVHLLNFLFGLNLRYYNGLPVYPRKMLSAIEIKSNGFGFQGEILVKLIKSRCSFVEVGVDGAEQTKRSFALRPRNIVSVVRTLLRLIFEIMRFKPVESRIEALRQQL